MLEFIDCLEPSKLPTESRPVRAVVEYFVVPLDHTLYWPEHERLGAIILLASIVD